MEQNHVKFNKIRRMRTVETEGILAGPVTIQEKIDGANASVWKAEDGELRFGSRNQMADLTDKTFKILEEYIRAHPQTECFFELYPNYRVFGEILVKHTIQYDETKMRKFYAFDIYDNTSASYLPASEAYDILKDYFEVPHQFARNRIVTEAELEKMVGHSEIGKHGEGVVIKSDTYTNKFGVYPQYGKMVSANFSERNAVVFGNSSKNNPSHTEVTICATFMTLARVRKQVMKVESMEDRACEMRDIPRICGLATHDMITEECWTIFNKYNLVSNQRLKKAAFNKAKQLFVDLINESVSVADTRVEEAEE